MSDQPRTNNDKQTKSANVTGSGAIAQGPGAVAAGEGGIAVGRDVYGGIHIKYERSRVEELRDYLDRAVAKYESWMYRVVAQPSAPPDQPYKFLYAFEIEDADIFFGRDAASDALHQTVLKDRFTVLHARSGAGKTSLLNAGLFPRLIREGRLPVRARAYDDPVLAIKRAIASPSLGPWPKLLPELTLHEFLGLACGHLSRQTQEMVIVVDQFEEFFVLWPEPGQRKPFIDALADCYDDKMLPLRIIVALRKDYYSDLADLEGRIGTIFHNQYRLDQMTRDEALVAITGPVTKLGRPVTYEQDLLDTLLDDLARGGMELPYLQIICTRLYEALAPSEQTISTDAYERLGRAEGVLGIYLTEVLERLPGKGPDIAKSVLRELVTAEATKRVLSYKTLEARLGADADELDSVLRRLVNARLLHRAEVADEVLYELAHECLIEEINKWIDVSDLELKLAEELMVREVESWRTHRTLIPEARLEMLYPYRDRFRGMDDEAWNCILYSALEIDRGVEGWLQAADERGVRLLVAIMRDEGPSFLEAPGVRPRDPEQYWFDADAIRMRAEVLGPVEDSHSAHRPIVDLGKGKTRVRGLAAMALGQVGEAAVDPLIDALSDNEWRVRRAAAESLGRIGDPRAAEPLVATLRFEDVDIRLAAVTALISIGEPAVTALKDALHSEVPGVRRSAVKALRGIGTSRALAMLEEEKD